MAGLARCFQARVGLIIAGVPENEELAGVGLCDGGWGSTRESEQVMKSARGAWFSESLVKRSFFLPNTSVRNFRNPLTSFSIVRNPYRGPFWISRSTVNTKTRSLS